jgi:hypothetical protein
MDFDDLEMKASRNQSEVVELKAQVHNLQARVERHALVIQVLKEMLLSGGDGVEAEFLDRLHTATLRKKNEGNTCQKCGKAMGALHTRCMYCGEPRPVELL